MSLMIIFACLKSTNQIHLQVAIKKGVNMGDPLTFFLFLSSFLVMESLGALCVKLLPRILNASICRDLKANWDSLAPSKVQTFGWQLILKRLPIHDNLAKRGILSGSSDVDLIVFGACPGYREVEDGLFCW